MTKVTWTRGHIHEQLIDSILADEYLIATCIEDYVSTLNDSDLEDIRKFVNGEEED